MNKFTLAFVLIVAALAAAGQATHASNPLTLNGRKLPVTSDIYPFPVCPPACIRHY